MRYPFGYNGRRLTAQEFDGHSTWNRLHPEFRRRLLSMFQAAQAAGTDLGIGGGWRSSEMQRQMFLSRYVVSPNGRISWDGKRWSKKPGVAAAAPPGRSYHEETDGQGFAFAADLVGDLRWMNANCQRFGLVHFANVNNEPWHVQPSELPRSRSQYQGQPLPVFALPQAGPSAVPEEGLAAVAAEIQRASRETLRRGSTGSAVWWMQTLLTQRGYPCGKPDGNFGPRTEAAVKSFQRSSGLLVDGVVGSKTWNALINPGSPK